MAGITHNVTLPTAQDALADALCELVEAQEEIARLRTRVERAEQALRDVMDRMSVGSMGCGVFSDNWPDLMAAIGRARGLLAEGQGGDEDDDDDAAPAGPETWICPACGAETRLKQHRCYRCGRDRMDGVAPADEGSPPP